MEIPSCYEATRQFAVRDRLEVASRAEMPHCQCCGQPILTDTALDLQPFGIAAQACQRCVDRHTYFSDRWIH